MIGSIRSTRRAAIKELPIPSVISSTDQKTTAPVSNPNLRIPAKVTGVNYVPGAFTASLSTEGEFANLHPGMKAKVRIEVAKFERAITVPNKLLHGDHLWVRKGDETERRNVKAGPTDGKVTVILHGLKEGEAVVAK